MHDRRLLYLTRDSLLVIRWHKGEQTADARFPATPAGPDAFAAYLNNHPQARYTLLVDLADEAFHLESLPLVRGGDRRRLIARRQNQLHLDTPFVTHIPLGRDRAQTGECRHERILFTALTRPSTLQPWLDALGHAGALLTGVHSVALVGMSLLRRLHTTEPQILLVHTSPAGLRISCFDNGQLRFSRLVPGAAAQPEKWQACRDEIHRTCQYLASQRALPRGLKTPVLLLAHPDQHDVIRAACPDAPEFRLNLTDLPALAVRCGLRHPSTDSDALPLILHLAAQERRQPQLAPPHALQQQRVNQIAIAICVAAASLLSVSLVIAAKNLIDVRQLNHQAAAVHTERVAETSRNAALAALIPQLPLPRPLIQASLAQLAALQALSAGPAGLFSQLASILDTHPEIELQQLDWTGIPADSPVQRVHLEAALPAASAPDTRALFTRRFLDALQTLPDSTLNIERQPYTADDRQVLRPSDPAAPTDLPRLGLRITLQPPRP